MSDYLHRGDAPFSEDVWALIDSAVVDAARAELWARRIIHVEGPYGLGLVSMPGASSEGEASETFGVSTTFAIPLAQIHATFKLASRDIASFERTGVAFSTSAASRAAVSVARREDSLVFHGSKSAGLTGLFDAEGVLSKKLDVWDEIGAAARNVIAASTILDNAGFHGPYALALLPARYNMLFRNYANTGLTELEQLRQIASEGVFKAPTLEEGGVLLATGRRNATIVLGQDVSTAFIGPDGPDYEFMISETVALKLTEPGSVCVLT